MPKVFLALSLLLVGLATPVPVQATNGDADKGRVKRETVSVSLSFPDVPGLGVLQMEGGSKVAKDSLGTLGGGTVNLAPARGKVLLKVPKGASVVLSVGPRLAENPRLLAGIDPTNIRELKMRVNTFDASEEGKPDRFLLSIGRLKNLKTISVLGSDVSNRGLLRLNELPALEALSLHSTMVDKRSLAFLSTLKALKMLDISELDMAGANFAPLANLPLLLSLSLNRTNIGDAEVKTLTPLKTVSSLFLRKNGKVTDASAVSLAAIKSLRFVDLVGTSVTEACLPRLKNVSMVVVGENLFPGQTLVDVRKRYPNVELEPAKGDKGRQPSKDELQIFAPTRY